MERKLRIVLDTGWYISGTINKKSRKTLYPLLVNQKLQIFYSAGLIQEYQRVIKRPFFAKYVSHEQVNRFIRLVLPVLTPIEIKSQMQLSRDSDDDHVLALAVDAGADYLISSDFDLLVLERIEKTRIVSMRQFLASESVKNLF